MEVEAKIDREVYRSKLKPLTAYDIISAKINTNNEKEVIINILINEIEFIKFKEEFPFISEFTLKKTAEEITKIIREDEKNNRDYSKIDWKSKELNELEFFESFRPYGEINDYCDSLASSFPSIVSKVNVGVTYEGETIYGYYISTGTGSGEEGKPVIYLEALQHAREWLAPPTLIYAFYSLLDAYSTQNQTILPLLEGIDWYIVPVVNIDGYKYTWTDALNARYWRKNRHPLNFDFVGVDLNRNWGPADTWCTTGSSKFEGSETYCGEYPFSEPESRSIAEFVDNIPNLVGGIDYHTYGSLLLWPWQYTYDHVPNANYSIFSYLGTDIVNHINFVNDQNFISEQGSDLYPHSGGFIDYNFITNNIIAYTLELRGNDFVVPASDIIPSGEEAFQGLLTFAQYLLNESLN